MKKYAKAMWHKLWRCLSSKVVIKMAKDMSQIESIRKLQALMLTCINVLHLIAWRNKLKKMLLHSTDGYCEISKSNIVL